MSCRPLNYPFPIQRWRQPSPEVLAGQRTTGGRPNFDPFLTATMLWQAHMCPVTAIHNLLHGQEVRPRVRSPHRRPRRFLSGKDWHRYIAHLRLKISSKRLDLPDDLGHALQVIKHDFEEWARNKQILDKDQAEIWDENVEPYVMTRLRTGQLAEIVGHALLPEVTIGTARVELPLNKGIRTYPIEARIDELDLTTGVVIERTSLPLDMAIPYKAVQLAIISAILHSLPAAGIPEEWVAVSRVGQFLLETPTHVIPVNPTSQLFDTIHEAAAIIRDVAASEMAEWPVYQLAQCTYLEPHNICSHPHYNCFYSPSVYPQSRRVLSRETRILCRAEMYELLWQRDLNLYRLYNPDLAGGAYPGLRLYILGTGEDRERGLFVKAQLEKGGFADMEQGILIVGTPFIGVRRKVTIEQDLTPNTLRLYCDLKGIPWPSRGVLWPTPSEGLLLRQDPYFLISQRQKDLFALRKIGTNTLQVAQGDAVLQILEAVFGGTPPMET